MNFDSPTRSAFTLLLVAALFSAATALAADPDDAGWTPLFNGQDLDGWKYHLEQSGSTNPGTFTVEDGVLVCSGSPKGYIYTPKSYSNYVLQFEFAFQRPEGLQDASRFRGNSGCLIHVADKNALGVWPRSIEVQGAHRQLGLILPIPRNLKCTKTFDREASEAARKPVGEFNLVEVEVTGGDMTIRLNGTPVATVGDCELTSGPIGFQSEGAATHWKNIRIRGK